MTVTLFFTHFDTQQTQDQSSCRPCLLTGTPSGTTFAASSYLDGNAPLFSDASLGAQYGWVAGNNTQDSFLQITLPTTAMIAGLETMGAAFGGLGVTEFFVRYAPTNNDPGGFVNNIGTFSVAGERCQAHSVGFARVVSAGAFRVYPTAWRGADFSLPHGVGAPAMRVGVSVCE